MSTSSGRANTIGNPNCQAAGSLAILPGGEPILPTADRLEARTGVPYYH